MLLAIWLLVFISCNLTYGATANKEFKLQIVHFNDFHAKFEEVSESGGTCKTKCIGGFSRLYTAIAKLKSQNSEAIVLNAGDNFQGSLWYTMYKWNVTQYFLNKLPIDALTLGNHDFDDKIAGVVPFIKALKASVVVANIDDSEEPRIQGIYKKSVVIKRSGKKIGIVGVMLSKTNEISRTEKLKFLDESELVNKEAARLVEKEKVDTVIVVSHSGYDVEKRIAERAGPKIGLIVGGHSHTFLYTGDNPPGKDKPRGNYPTVVTQPNGRKVLVVQASCYTKYLGNISVSYNEDGEVVSYSGNPIYLNKSIPQDKKINEELAVWKVGVDAMGKEVFGNTRVTLDYTGCRNRECNLGNFITDAMIYAHLSAKESNSWTEAAIAITNAGSLRTSLSKGEVTYKDLVNVIPFDNTIDIGELEGKYIKEFLEAGTKYPYRLRESSNRNLMQASGIRVVYNMSNPAGSRCQSIRIRCRECTTPEYEDIDFQKTYKLAINSFVIEGGDGFGVVSKNLKNRIIGPKNIDVVKKYIKIRSPIIQPLDERVKIVG